MFTIIHHHIKISHLWNWSGSESGSHESVRPLREATKTLEISQKDLRNQSHLLEGEIVSKKISDILKKTFDTTGIAFDRAKFEATFQTALSDVMMDERIPFIAKKKFLEDVSSKTHLLSNISLVDIENLRSQRNV
jgi:hypothetical protein